VYFRANGKWQGVLTSHQIQPSVHPQMIQQTSNVSHRAKVSWSSLQAGKMDPTTCCCCCCGIEGAAIDLLLPADFSRRLGQHFAVWPRHTTSLPTAMHAGRQGRRGRPRAVKVPLGSSPGKHPTGCWCGRAGCWQHPSAWAAAKHLAWSMLAQVRLQAAVCDLASTVPASCRWVLGQAVPHVH
jgi:hypothetical protein